MAEPARLFIAVELPEVATAHIASVVHSLRGRVKGVRWVRLEGVHLTLKFLGNVPEGQTPSILRAMESAVAEVVSFALRVQGAGVFPTPQAPRVVWLGLEGELEPLGQLQLHLEEELAREGFPPERRAFSPHLTLGRIQGRLSVSERQQLLGALDTLAGQEGPGFSVSAVSLMESTLSPAGAIYTRRASIPLPGAFASGSGEW